MIINTETKKIGDTEVEIKKNGQDLYVIFKNNIEVDLEERARDIRDNVVGDMVYHTGSPEACLEEAEEDFEKEVGTEILEWSDEDESEGNYMCWGYDLAEDIFSDNLIRPSVYITCPEHTLEVTEERVAGWIKKAKALVIDAEKKLDDLGWSYTSHWMKK